MIMKLIQPNFICTLQYIQMFSPGHIVSMVREITLTFLFITSPFVNPFIRPEVGYVGDVGNLRTRYNSETFKCPLYCSCVHETVVCKNKGKTLNYIPFLPIITTRLVFIGNYLPFVSQKTFQNIDFLQLQGIDISNNSIRHLTPNAFTRFTTLFDLKLSQNSFLSSEVVSEVLESLNNTISNLVLNQMGWQFLSTDFFKRFQPTHIYSLSLNNNYLTTLRFSTVSSIFSLNLGNNILSKVPNFCSEEKHGFFPNLNELTLRRNNIYELRNTSFLCLNKLQSLDLSTNPIHVIRNGFLYPLKSLNELYLMNLDRLEMKIEKYGFLSNSLKILQLAGQFIIFPDPDFYMDSMFEYCPNLQVLAIRNNYLPFDLTKFKRIFTPLQNLEELELRNNDLEEMPVHFFSLFPKLRKIDLTGNKLSSWDGNAVFENISTLKSLSLLYNVISIVNETSFPPLLLSGMESLNLGKNRLSCTCGNLWFRNWIRTTKVELGQYPQWYECDSPVSLKKNNVTFKDFNPTIEDCTPKNILVPIVSTTSTIIISAVVVSVLVYKCRWHIRYRIYLMKKHKYKQITSEDEFVYWGFVIYSDNDRQWVHDILLHHLEDKEGLRLCIRLRDFDVGKVIVDNIVENMNLSKKVILVLSNNFAQSEWCQFELLLAQSRLMKEGSETLVLIMLEEIDSSHLTNTLHALITTTTYSVWSTEEPALMLFWEQITTAMKRQNTPVCLY